jgi:hypothetical protein
VTKEAIKKDRCRTRRQSSKAPLVWAIPHKQDREGGGHVWVSPHSGCQRLITKMRLSLWSWSDLAFAHTPQYV